MSFSSFRSSDLPSLSQLEEARQALHSSEHAFNVVSRKIKDAEDALAKIIKETKQTIDKYTVEQAAIQQEMTLIRGLIAPIRRLPSDLLREVFLTCFEHSASSAWTLAAVCSTWRRLALSVPILWSKIRLELTQNDSPDIIRLWVERSGLRCPLDIEITLQVSSNPATTSVTPRPRRGSRSCFSYPPPFPSPPISSVNNPPLNSHGLMLPSLGFLSPPYSHTNSPSSPNSSSSQHQASGRATNYWGYIAFYYLTSQIERWERFVFRFDRSFSSIPALKNITGPAPLLKHFEVTCSEPSGFYFDNTWTWLPTQQQTSVSSLRSFTLSHMPFKWSSSMLNNGGLTSISIRALAITTLSLDRLQHILTSNATSLIDVFLALPTTQCAILPLTPLTLPALTTLSFSGHHLLLTLLDNLVLPSLDSLSLTLDLSRHPDSLEDTLLSLIIRSSRPMLKSLTIAHGPNGLFYATPPILPGGVGSNFSPWSFLTEVPALTHLTASNSAVEPLLSMLTGPDEDTGFWVCPDLNSLTFRSCYLQVESVTKLVTFINARNPPTTPGSIQGQSVVTRIQSLELLESLAVDVDVQEWLKSRVPNVTIVEPVHERAVLGFVINADIFLSDEC
ncbi:hypothetical protein Clacol_009036 [Clathrus columnatus]|uniref:F-box domain-containing protein n=1 Tax=Clathrus columnatus TaxID=1419009 RepID=A0AAV5ANY5_9AGAM|nr:hypothetical protein Clacol_009036 [Clathrus columnatus]